MASFPHFKMKITREKIKNKTYLLQLAVNIKSHKTKYRTMISSLVLYVNRWSSELYGRTLLRYHTTYTTRSHQGHYQHYQGYFTLVKIGNKVMSRQVLQGSEAVSFRSSVFKKILIKIKSKDLHGYFSLQQKSCTRKVALKVYIPLHFPSFS